MAYKSLIDYYGGGMVKPSQGYQLGGLIARSGRQRGYTREFKNIKELAEQAAKRKEKVGGNWLRKLAVGTAGTFLGGPAGAAAALAADQALREKKFKKTDFGGGKYAQDIRKDLGKQETAFKEKGLARVGIAGVEGYLGGKGGGTYGKTAGFLKGLPTDISMVKGAMAAKDGATFLEAAKGVGWDIPSMFGGKASMAGSLLPSIAPKATNAPSLYEQSGAALAGAESGAMQAAGMTVNPVAMGTAGMIANTTDEQDFQQWAGMTGAPPVAEQAVAPTQEALTQPLTSIQRGDVLGNEYMERVRAAGAGGPEPEMEVEQDIYQLPQVDVFGGSPEPETGLAQTDWYDEPEDEYPSYGSQPQQQPAWAGGFEGGGLVDYMMPQGYQGGGQVGYGTATDPEQALRQMGMDDVANDPALGEHLDDLPRFTMGYKQQLGDVTAGARTGLLNIGKEGRLTGARTGFAGGGGWMNPEARQAVQRQFGSQKRGIVESYQADLLSAISDIEQKIGGDFTFGSRGSTNMASYPVAPTSEAGWMPPTGAARGQIYTYGGENWYYSDNDWVTEDEYNDRDQGEGE